MGSKAGYEALSSYRRCMALNEPWQAERAAPERRGGVRIETRRAGTRSGPVRSMKAV
jgi:hypothetical protein